MPKLFLGSNLNISGSGLSGIELHNVRAGRCCRQLSSLVFNDFPSFLPKERFWMPVQYHHSFQSV